MEEELTIEPRRGGFQKLVSVGKFVRDYLLEHDEATMTGIHNAYKDEVYTRYEAAGKKILKKNLMTYNSFAVYFAKLRRLGWVERTKHRERSKPQEWYEEWPELIYYKITDKGREAKDSDWSNPVYALYGHYQY